MDLLVAFACCDAVVRWRDNSTAKAAIIDELTTELDRLTNGRWSSEIARLSHDLITMTAERDHLRYIMQMPMQYVVLSIEEHDKLQADRREQWAMAVEWAAVQMPWTLAANNLSKSWLRETTAAIRSGKQEIPE